MSNDKPYYYWSNRYRYHKKTLQYYYDLYGTGEKMLSIDTKLEVIWFSPAKTFRFCWTLRLSEIHFGRNIPMGMCEKYKTYGSFNMHPHNHIVYHCHKLEMPPYYNATQTNIISKLKKQGVRREDLL